jgi:beta-lactamase regulating signal transducer with metallopeptidase domain
VYILFEPAVVGIFKPVLLLPSGIAERMTAEQLQAILIHEFSHIRRRDNLAGTVYMAAETLFWFYPLVHWIGKHLIEERERAGDEEVLRLGHEPLTYAEGILSICKSYIEAPLRCLCGVTG